MIPQLVANGLISGCAYALVALGFGLVYRTARFFHFAHAAVFLSGAYGAWYFSAKAGWSFSVAVVLAVDRSSGPLAR